MRNTMTGAFASVAAVLMLCDGGRIAGAQEPAMQSVSPNVVLRSVTIVDTHNGALTPNQSVRVEGGKITHIGPAAEVRPVRQTRVVDAHGKYLVPGFWDMHAHVFDGEQTKNNLALMLANGITGFRQMADTDEQLKARKAGTLMPAEDAPELLAMAGVVLTHANASTPEQAVAEVKRQKAEGADFIKTIDVTPPAFYAAAEEAKREGLPYAGHLSFGVDAVKASQIGMSSIEHMGPQELLFISCSSAEPAIRKMMADHPPGLVIPPSLTPKDFNTLASDPVLLRMEIDPQFLSRLPGLLATYDEAKCRKVAQVFKQNNTWLCPTLIRDRAAQYADEGQYAGDPNLKYINPETRQLWAMLGGKFSTEVKPEQRDALRQFTEMQAKLAKLFSDEGVGMLAGDDTPGIWVIPGFGLHREFDLLADAGFSPMKVLQMTTINGAVYLGKLNTAGSVEIGKDANLVLLDGNPLDSVQNLHRISGVVREGKYYSRNDLDKIKQKVAQDQASRAAIAKPAEKSTP